MVHYGVWHEPHYRLVSVVSQAKRAKVRATVAKRERLAKAIAVAVEGHVWPAPGAMQNPGRLRASAILSGSLFDVYAVRGHALELVRGYAENDHARNMCALGLDLLTAIDEQPSECQTEDCDDGQVWHHMGPSPCPDCWGTGHNLRGALPAVEWSAQAKRRVADSVHAVSDTAGALDVATERMFEDMCTDGEYEWCEGRLDALTRTVARGQHRGIEGPMTPSGREVGGYGPFRWCPESNGVRFSTEHGYSQLLSYAPSWRRGELVNAERQFEQRWQSEEGRLMKPQRLIPYTDEASPMLRDTIERVWAETPDEHKRYLQKTALDMTAEDWDAFAVAVIQQGPSAEEQELNAIPTDRPDED